MKKAAIWIAFASFILPLIISPRLFTYAVGGKTVLIRGLAFGIIACITLAIFFERKVAYRLHIAERVKKVAKHPIFLTLFVGAIALALSTIFAYDPVVAFFGELTRAEGALTLYAFLAFAFGVAVVFSRKNWNHYFVATSLLGIATLGLMLWQISRGSDRPDALIGNPIFLATYLLFTFFTGAMSWIAGKKEFNRFYKVVGILAMVTSVIGILLTKTRGTIFAFAVAAVVSLVVLLVKGKGTMLGKKTLRFWSAIILGLIIVVTGLFVATKKNTFWQRVPGFNRLAETSLSEGSAAARIEFTTLSLNGFFGESGATRMLFGWGWDNYLYFFQDQYNPIIFQYESKLADRSHDKLVDVLVMSGIVGLILYLAAWFLLFKYTFRIMRKYLSVGLAILFFLVAYFVNNLFTFDVTSTYLAFYAVVAFIVFNALESSHES